MADHLHALGLAARKRAAGAIEAEIAKPDLHEGVEGLPQHRQQRPDRRLIQAPHPLGEVADLHRAGIGDVDRLDLRGSRRLAQAGAVAVGAGGEGDRSLHERADVRLQRLLVLGEHRLLNPRDQPFVGHVDARDLHPRRLVMEEVVQFLLGVLADRLLRVDESRCAVEPVVPAARRVAGDRERALRKRLRILVELGEVDVGDRAPPLAARAHAAGAGEGLADGLAVTPLHGDRPARPHRGDVEGERVGRADVRLPEPAEEDAQHRVGVGGGTDGGARVGAHPLLIDDDRGRQPFEHIDLGPRQARHEALHERAVGLVDQPLGLCGDRAEHERALARARDAGEHRQPTLRDLDAHVLEVVHARAVDADRVVAVGAVGGRRALARLRGCAHLLCIRRPGPLIAVTLAAATGPRFSIPDRLDHPSARHAHAMARSSSIRCSRALPVSEAACWSSACASR